MVLELMENEVVANVDNGKGPFSASYKLGNKFSLCDGNWHKIHGKSFFSCKLPTFLRTRLTASLV